MTKKVRVKEKLTTRILLIGNRKDSEIGKWLAFFEAGILFGIRVKDGRSVYVGWV